MRYNFLEIGGRIRDERKKLKNGLGRPLTQDDLIERLSLFGISIGRNSMSDLENGDISRLDIDLLLRLCEIFDCDIGYLLCEYHTKRRVTADVCEATGLSSKAVERLCGCDDYYYKVGNDKRPHPENNGLPPSEVLTRLIESDAFWRVLGNMSEWTKRSAQEHFAAADLYNPLRDGLPCVPGVYEPNPAFEPYGKDSTRELLLASAVRHFGQAAEAVLLDCTGEQATPTKQKSE